MEDKEIVALYFARSEEAIARTKEKFGSGLFSLARRIVRNDGDAEECESDTYLDAWNSIPPQKPDPLKPYLFSICRKNAVSRARKLFADKRGGGAYAAVFEELEDFLPAAEGDFADQIALRDALNGFLNGLREKERGIFLRRYFYMCSISDISSEYGMGVSSVKMTLLRTRAELKKHLENAGFTI